MCCSCTCTCLVFCVGLGDVEEILHSFRFSKRKHKLFHDLAHIWFSFVVFEIFLLPRPRPFRPFFLPFTSNPVIINRCAPRSPYFLVGVSCCVFIVVEKPLLVSDLLPDLIIPGLYSVVELKLERTVDLGPFKHKVSQSVSGWVIHTMCNTTALP